MNQAELDAIKMRAEAAMSGPWICGAVPRSVFVETESEYCIMEKDSDKVGDYNNAEFIANAREDIPKLLAEIERLKIVANDILEEYDSSERRVIDEISTSRKFALHIHEVYLKYCKDEINGVYDDGADL